MHEQCIVLSLSYHGTSGCSRFHICMCFIIMRRSSRLWLVSHSDKSWWRQLLASGQGAFNRCFICPFARCFIGPFAEQKEAFSDALDALSVAVHQRAMSFRFVKRYNIGNIGMLIVSNFTSGLIRAVNGQCHTLGGVDEDIETALRFVDALGAMRHEQAVSCWRSLLSFCSFFWTFGHHIKLQMSWCVPRLRQRCCQGILWPSRRSSMSTSFRCICVFFPCRSRSWQSSPLWKQLFSVNISWLRWWFYRKPLFFQLAFPTTRVVLIDLVT